MSPFHPPASASVPPSRTRQRLLEGATRVFSRKGYEAATTRMIAEEAGVNLASIPYYFGTKEALYAEVLASLCRSINIRTTPLLAEIQILLPSDPGAAACLDALDRLVDAHVAIVMADDMVVAAPILAREQASPSTAFPVLFEQMIRPQLDLAAALLARILDLPAESPEVRVKAYALLGMSVHIAYARQSFQHYIGEALTRNPGPIRGWIRDLVRQAVRPRQD